MTEVKLTLETCKFVHTGKTGGKKGTVCGRTEAEHCPEGFGCREEHPRTGSQRPVHHPFHRASKREATK